MINWVDERYFNNTMKLIQSYDIALFDQSQDRQVLQALVVILDWVTQIESYEAMVRMAFNIIECLGFYKFVTYLSNEISKNIFNIDKGDFRNSSYLW